MSNMFLGLYSSKTLQELSLGHHCLEKDPVDILRKIFTAYGINVTNFGKYCHRMFVVVNAVQTCYKIKGS